MLSLIFVLKVVIKQLNPSCSDPGQREWCKNQIQYFFLAVLKQGNKILSIASTMELQYEQE